MPRKSEKEGVEENAPEVLEETVQEVAPVDSSTREERWEKFLEKAQIQNPIKFAQKKVKGEFKNIPDSFR